jgi:cytidine deaminase
MAVVRSSSVTASALCEAAAAAKTQAHCPYSGLRVGAALALADGSVITAANVENSSYPLSVCAETAAVVKAISEGHTRIEAVAISSDAPTVSPCGGCRQVLAEFAGPDVPITFPVDGKPRTVPLGQLLPHAFRLDRHG